MFNSYNDLQIWSEIPKHFPEKSKINDLNRPQEVFWNWKDNKIHLDYYRNLNSKVKVILLHGVGGNGRLLSFIAVPLHKCGYEVIAPDLPGYGISKLSKVEDYSDWISMLNDLINDEIKKDGKPVILFGLSAGGMLAYHSACMNGNISGLIVTNLLDQRLQDVRDGSAANKLVSRIGIPLLRVLLKINDNIRLPMKAIANMNAIVNDDQLLKLLIKDKTSSGASVPLRLIMSLVDAEYEIEPEDFNICPVFMVHPENDMWTPINLSRLFFDRLDCEKELVVLKDAGHFPIEKGAVDQLEKYVVAFIDRILDSSKPIAKELN